MLLDRLLDSAGLDVVPVAVCDVRKGVRVELPALDEAHLHCVVRGKGALRDAAGNTLALSPASIAIVPARTPHGLEPEGRAERVLKVGAAVSSDHVPALTAGGGEPGLMFVCGRIRSAHCEGLGLWDRLTAPLVVDLSDIALVQSLLDAVLEEQAGRAPGNRRLTALLLQQCLMYALRRSWQDAASPVPWLQALKDPGFSRALDAMLRAPASPHSAKSLAASAGLSRTSFSHRFTQAFGHGPIDWLNQLRLQGALRLLRTSDVSLDAAAACVGLRAGSPLLRQLRAGAESRGFEAGVATEARRRGAQKTEQARR